MAHDLVSRLCIDGMGESQSDALEEELLSEVHRVLSNADRRELLAWLAEREDRRPSLAELVDVVAKNTTDTERHRARTALHHVHLPMLEEADIIQYDADRQRIVNTDGEHRAVQIPVAKD